MMTMVKAKSWRLIDLEDDKGEATDILVGYYDKVPTRYDKLISSRSLDTEINILFL